MGVCVRVAVSRARRSLPRVNPSYLPTRYVDWKAKAAQEVIVGCMYASGLLKIG